ncbi:hypothetical protein, conserved [Leishmania tarentolae]|uniref:Uncharacterized protein n=1 Tax=Leishmania tarentolae TaxID=5689 RepID=A0A640KUK0_LEITA|nr:hypothetical protein, conserved [Leishmania tarentolae]
MVLTPKRDLSQYSFSEPARGSAKVSDTSTSTLIGDWRRSSTGSIRVIGVHAPDVKSESEHVCALPSHRLARKARLPVALAEPANSDVERWRERHTPSTSLLPSSVLAQTWTSSSSSAFSAPAAQFALEPFALAPRTAKEVDKVTSATGVTTVGEAYTRRHATMSNAENSKAASSSRASLRTGETKQLAQVDWMMSKPRFSSRTPSILSTTLSESPGPNEASTVFSVRRSASSNAVGHAAINNAERESVALYSGLPYASQTTSRQFQAVNNTKETPQLFPYDTPSSTHAVPLGTTVTAIGDTSSGEVGARHLSPFRGSQRPQMPAEEQDGGCFSSATSTPGKTGLPLFAERKTFSARAMSSSVGRPTASRGPAPRQRIHASLQHTRADVPPLAFTSSRQFAPFTCFSTAPRSESYPSSQPFSEENSCPNRQDFSVPGVCLRDHSDLKYTQSTSRERSYPRRMTSVETTSSTATCSGRLRSASTERDISLSSAFSVKMPIFSSSRHCEVPRVRKRVASSPSLSNTSVSHSALRSAVYTAFLATTVRSRYKLLDDSTATLATTSSQRGTIAEELAMQRRLSLLKSELMRQRMDQMQHSRHRRTL